MLFYKMVANDATRDEVLLDDAFEHRRVALAVPSALGVHNGNRAAFADSQAIRLRPQDTALLRQAKLLEPPLQEVPRGEAAPQLATLGRPLIAAEKDVTPRDWHSDARGNPFL
jgi:hypothetical protein